MARIVKNTVSETVGEHTVAFEPLQRGSTYFHPLASHRQSFSLTIGEREYWGELIRTKVGNGAGYVVDVELRTRNARTGHGVTIRETAMAGLRSALILAFRKHVSDSVAAADAAMDDRAARHAARFQGSNDKAAVVRAAAQNGDADAQEALTADETATSSRYAVIITRDTTESAVVHVEAVSESEAGEMALQMADSATFEPDDGNTPQPAYVTGCEPADDTPAPAPAVRRDNVEYHAGRAAWAANATKDSNPYPAGGERAARWDLGWQEACDSAAPALSDSVQILKADGDRWKLYAHGARHSRKEAADVVAMIERNGGAAMVVPCPSLPAYRFDYDSLSQTGIIVRLSDDTTSLRYTGDDAERLRNATPEVLEQEAAEVEFD